MVFPPPPPKVMMENWKKGEEATRDKNVSPPFWRGENAFFLATADGTELEKEFFFFSFLALFATSFPEVLFTHWLSSSFFRAHTLIYLQCAKPCRINDRQTRGKCAKKGGNIQKQALPHYTTIFAFVAVSRWNNGDSWHFYSFIVFSFSSAVFVFLQTFWRTVRPSVRRELLLFLHAGLSFATRNFLLQFVFFYSLFLFLFVKADRVRFFVSNKRVSKYFCTEGFFLLLLPSGFFWSPHHSHHITLPLRGSHRENSIRLKSGEWNGGERKRKEIDRCVKPVCVISGSLWGTV